MGKAFNAFRQGLAHLLFAPFVALAAFFGLTIIAFAQVVQSVEILTGWGLYGDWLYDAGVGQLPDFYF